MLKMVLLISLSIISVRIPVLRKADGLVETRLIQIACCSVPEGHSKWTLRLLEERCWIELEPQSAEKASEESKKTSFALTTAPTGVFHQKKTPNL